MNPGIAQVTPDSAILFRDGLGDRVLLPDTRDGKAAEMLKLRAELTAVPSFEFALSEQIRRLEGFDHAGFARVRRLDRLSERLPRLGLVSDHMPGLRLSEILEETERRRLTLDMNAALYLIGQIVAAMAGLHQHLRDLSHGALGPERILITAPATPVIVECALGSALEQLRFSHERYWKELRIAVPPSAGPARFDHRADVAQIGMVALALILGRPLREEEHLRNIGEVLAGAIQVLAGGAREPLVRELRSWLSRVLQTDPRHSFVTALEAQQAFSEMLAVHKFTAASQDLEAFMGQHHEALRAALQVPLTVAQAAASAETGHRETVTRGPWAPPRVESETQRSAAAVDPWTAPDVDPIGVFATPTVREKPKPPARPVSRYELLAEPTGRSWRRVMTACAMLVAFAAGGIAAARMYEADRLNLLRFYNFVYSAPMAVFSPSGTLVVESRPAGLEVVVDGESRGVTPISLTIKRGAHVLELHGSGEPRVIPLTVPAGGRVAQYIEFAPKGRVARARPAAGAPVADGEAPKTAAEPPTAVPSLPAAEPLADPTSTGATLPGVAPR